MRQWWSEQRCTGFFWNSTVKLHPDGYGCWAEHGQWVRFFLEYDKGTEALSKVTRKIADYGAFPTDSFGILLFSVHSAKREWALRQALRPAVGTARPPLVIASTPRDQAHPPSRRPRRHRRPRHPTTPSRTRTPPAGARRHRPPTKLDPAASPGQRPRRPLHHGPARYLQRTGGPEEGHTCHRGRAGRRR